MENIDARAVETRVAIRAAGYNDNTGEMVEDCYGLKVAEGIRGVCLGGILERGA
jgi:hypothetical protein